MDPCRISHELFIIRLHIPREHSLGYTYLYSNSEVSCALRWQSHGERVFSAVAHSQVSVVLLAIASGQVEFGLDARGLNGAMHKIIIMNRHLRFR